LVEKGVFSFPVFNLFLGPNIQSENQIQSKKNSNTKI